MGSHLWLPESSLTKLVEASEMMIDDHLTDLQHGAAPVFLPSFLVRQCSAQLLQELNRVGHEIPTQFLHLNQTLYSEDFG